MTASTMNILKRGRILFILTAIMIAVAAWLPQRGRAVTMPTDSALVDFIDGERAFEQRGNYGEALDHLLRFLQRSADRPADYPEQLMKAYSIVGLIYGSYNDYTKALHFNELSYELSKKLDNRRYQVTTLSNISEALIALGRYDEARRYVEMLGGVDFDDRAHQLFNYHILLGEIAQHTERGGKCLTHWHKALQIARENGFNNYAQAGVYTDMASYYKQVGKPDSQLVCLMKTSSLADGQGDPYPKISSARELMQFYVHQGDVAQAAFYQDRYLALTDSFMNLESFLRIRSNHEQYEMNAAGEQISSLTLTTIRLKWLLFIGLAVVCVLGWFLYTVFRQKRNLNEAYRSLVERNRELVAIEESMKPKETEEQEEKRQPVRDDQLFRRIEEVMQNTQEYCNPDFGLAHLTSMVGSNTAYVSAVIKAETDMNVRAYINNYRIKEARRRLTDQEHYGQYTLQAIAESVGYSTQVNFNRTFKKLTGVTPSIYQKTMAQSKK